MLDEIGPAHKKTFYVQLKLRTGSKKDEEVYVGNGTSIKKAQQTVAEMAYRDTKFKKPPLSSTRDKSDQDLVSNNKKKVGKNAVTNKKQQGRFNFYFAFL